MGERRIGLIMHGITGRMGYNQHLVRSVLAIRDAGGVALAGGDRLIPDPILVGRNADRVRAIAERHCVARWSDDLDAALADPANAIFFDAGTTQMRAGLLERALAAGKHVYCEKPTSDDLAAAVRLSETARASGLKHGVVQDKLFLPGLMKLRHLREAGFFGRMLSVRGEFGYWVFEGDWQKAQRPSWNYRLKDGGGIMLDMLCHWRYVLDNVFAPVRAVTCLGARHIPERVDEAGKRYAADADDAAYATFELEGGVIAQINSSWTVRVRRDDLVTFQVDGTHGSAVAGLHRCWTQHRVNTPKPIWNPDEPQTMDFFADWKEVPDNWPTENGFRAQWEMFLRHVAEDGPWPYGLEAGAKGVQLAALGLQSWRERRWLDVPDLGL
jgi:predicted dehydrogenase